MTVGRWLRATWLCCIVGWLPVPVHAQHAAAAELEGRLYAPCCYVQTLDIHDSPLADQLRKEIVARLSLGERAEALENELVARYGEKILAVPRGKDPRVEIPVVVTSALAVGLLMLWRAARGWQRSGASRSAVQPAAVQAHDDALLDEAMREDREDS